MPSVDGAVGAARPRPAVRVPVGTLQTPLPFVGPRRLFLDEGARQSLERRLQVHLSIPLSISVTDHRQTMISTRRRANVLWARVHHMFLAADPATIRLLARYLARPDRRTSLRIGVFIEAHRHLIRSPDGPPRGYRTVGQHHDLAETFARVNRRYFGGQVDAQITWGVRPPRRRRRTIKFGSYSLDERLIRVHPALDRRTVPRYFVEYIVFHEMLHHVLPAREKNGRHAFHGTEFSAREKHFRHFERALAWERKNLGRLLAS